MLVSGLWAKRSSMLNTPFCSHKNYGGQRPLLPLDLTPSGSTMVRSLAVADPNCDGRGSPSLPGQEL